MSTIATAALLRSAFRDIDREDVDTTGVSFPLAVDDVTTWSFGPRAYLVFRDHPEGKVKGIVFHRNTAPAPQVATMCQWCHRVRGGGGVKLLSVRADKRHSVGTYLCSDLDCLHGDDSVDGLRETIDDEARRARTLERIRSFAVRRVF